MFEADRGDPTRTTSETEASTTFVDAAFPQVRSVINTDMASETASVGTKGIRIR